MNFKEYIKDKVIYIILLIFTVITCEILLIPFKINIFVKVYIGICPIIMFFICFFIEYYKKRNFYNNVKDKMRELEDKYLIAEIIQSPNFLEGEILKDTLQETGKSMLENVNKYKYLRSRL